MSRIDDRCKSIARELEAWDPEQVDAVPIALETLGLVYDVRRQQALLRALVERWRREFGRLPAQPRRASEEEVLVRECSTCAYELVTILDGGEG